MAAGYPGTARFLYGVLNRPQRRVAAKAGNAIQSPEPRYRAAPCFERRRGRIPDLGSVPGFLAIKVRRERLHIHPVQKIWLKDRLRLEDGAGVGEEARADIWFVSCRLGHPVAQANVRPEGRRRDARGPLTGESGQRRTISCRIDPAIRCKERGAHRCAAFWQASWLRDEMAMASASLYLQSPVLRDSSGGRCKDRLHAIT